jgi:diaminopimelate epimerase
MRQKEIGFSKYHGCGNDFIVINESALMTESRTNEQYSQLARLICSRTTGIGADGLLVVRMNPLQMIIYNSDGSRAPMCGNGIRCFAQHCYEDGIVSKSMRAFSVLTDAGEMQICIDSTEPFVTKINLGLPDFNLDRIGLRLENVEKCLSTQSIFDGIINVSGEEIRVNSVFMGTIHTVIWVDESMLNSTILSLPFGQNANFAANSDNDVLGSLVRLGFAVSDHPAYSEKTNVNFARIIDFQNVEMITYERGAGFTAACGTGACAVAVAGFLSGNLNAKIDAHLMLGTLTIDITDTGVYMTGPSARVATGTYILPDSL